LVFTGVHLKADNLLAYTLLLGPHQKQKSVLAQYSCCWGHFEIRVRMLCSCYWGPFKSRVLAHCSCYSEPNLKAEYLFMICYRVYYKFIWVDNHENDKNVLAKTWSARSKYLAHLLLNIPLPLFIL